MSKISLPDRVGIAIQGPTAFAQQVIQFWSQFRCPITWGTWTDEPAKNVLNIERAGIEVVLIDKPQFEGFLNTNLHHMSSFAAIQALSKHNVTDVLKIRSDCLLYGLENIWPLGKDLSFMYSYNPEYSVPYVYYLDGKYHYGLDFPLDHAFFGNINTLLHITNGYEESIRVTGAVPGESILLKRWLDLNKLEDNFQPEFLKKHGLHYWGPDAIKYNSILIWLKNNWDMTSMMVHESNLRVF